MTCEQLKDDLIFYCGIGHSQDEVVVLLSEKSLGPRASSQIERIILGFDWDNGRLIIEPSERLVSDIRSRDAEKMRTFWHDVLHCPTCERLVTKKAKYCEHCGQKFAKEIKVVETIL